MRLPQFAYRAPKTLDQALRIKAEMGASAPVLAGGTDLVVTLKHRLVSPAALISLRNVKEIRGIEAKPDSIILRAGTSLAETVASPVVQEHFPVLVKAIQSIGAVSIQHYRGTIGGNLCLPPRCIMYNQSHFWRLGKGSCHRTGGKDCLVLPGSESCMSICSGDTVPVLTALSAQLTLASFGGRRIVPIGEFFTGKGESPFNILPEEILTEIRIPLPWKPFAWSYQRVALRSAVDFPLINAAAVAIEDKGKVESLRLVLCAAGPAPIILREAEKVVKGLKPHEDMASKVEELAVAAVQGIIVENAVTSKEYRIKMAGVVARRAVKEALGL